jgi:hypothetical protein
MNSGEDERLRGDAITLGVRTSVSCDCDCHVPTYLPYLDGKSSDGRGALELLPSGARAGSLARSQTHRLHRLRQATSICAAGAGAAARAREK